MGQESGRVMEKNTGIAGWMIFNGSLNDKKYVEIDEMYRLAAYKAGIMLECIPNNGVAGVIQGRASSSYLSDSSSRPDFILFADKDVRLAKHLELCGYRLFNNSSAIATCDDKIMTYQALSAVGIAIPKTIFAPLAYRVLEEAAKNRFLEMIEDELNYPIVVKEAFGSFGEQVYLAKNRQELSQLYNRLQLKPHLYQQYISSSFGRDVRLHVVGDRVVASMLRTNENDFRANITNGGKMHSFTPSEAFQNVAIEASKAVNADYSGVDLLFGADGEPIVCEINSNAHIKNILNCTGINIADIIFEYILRTIKC